MTAAALVTVDPLALAPALLPALGAVLVLVGDALLPGRRPWPLPVAVLILVVAAGTALVTAVRPASEPVRTLCLPAPDGACLWTAGPTTGTLQAGILLSAAASLALLHDAGRGPRDTTVTTALVLTAATGGAGVAASRDIGAWLVTIELDMVPTRWAVHIPNPWFIKDISDIATDQNNAAASALLDHLTWWATALKKAR